MLVFKDYYEILGVSPNATFEEISIRYKELAKKYHPDISKDKEYENLFKEISEAYNTLKDKKKRKKYDEIRKYYLKKRKKDYIDKDSAKFFNFSELIKFFFEKGEKEKKEEKVEKKNKSFIAQDLIFPITISPWLAFFGGKKEISLKYKVICESCKGLGGKENSRTITCPDCQGRGLIFKAKGGFGISKPCIRCSGKGKIFDNICKFCGGKGFIYKMKKIKITIPQGIKENQKLRLKIKDFPELSSIFKQDIFLNVSIEKKEDIKIKNECIIIHKKINFARILLGGKININVYGHNIAVSLPSVKNYITEIKIPMSSLPFGVSRGFMILKLEMEFPLNLTERQRALLLEFLKEEKNGEKYYN